MYYPIPRRTSAGRGAAFTLIELLVVIAIIAILAAILFPVFAKVREKARQTACLSNEKQIGLGIMQYCQDFDEVMPMGGWGNSASLPKWTDLIYPYVKSTQAYDCPDCLPLALEFVPCKDLNNCAASRSGYRLGTIGANGAYWGGHTYTGGIPTHGPMGQPLSAIQSPGGTIQAAEIVYADKSYNNVSCSWDYDINNPVYDPTQTPPKLKAGGNNGNIASVVHSGGMNLVFCDGHAKWMTGDLIVATHTVGGHQICYLWTIEDD